MSCRTFAMLLVLAIIITVNADNQCYFCSHSVQGCTICYSNCTSLVFNSCQDSDGPMNQSQCVRSCCSNSNNANVFTKQILDNCIEDTNSHTNTLQSIGYYAILCGGSIAVLILLIIIVRAIYQRIKLPPLRSNRRIIPLNHMLQITRNQISVNQLSRQEIQTKEYPQNYKQIVEDESNTCCICLDTNINALTRCGHVFHVYCLASWGSRKNSCPLCNYKDIHEAKHFCSYCKSQKSVLDFRRLNLVQVDKISKEVCSYCGK